MPDPRLALVTCAELPVPDPDRAIIDDALDAHGGIDAEWTVWTDPDVAWEGFDVVWLRTPWDYIHHYRDFLAWLERVGRVSTMLNPPSVVAWNSHKAYLLDLAGAGVEVVPTELRIRPSTTDLDEVLLRRGWTDTIIKPAISVGAIGASRVMPGDPTNAAALAEAIDGIGESHGDVLVQPFVAEVVDGEISIIVVDGVPSHAVRKVPAAGDFRVHLHYGGSEHAYEPTEHELDLARRAVAAVPVGPGEPLLYARVDIVTSALGVPMLMELELIEPSLFLRQAPPPVVTTLIAAVAHRLGGAHSSDVA